MPYLSHKQEKGWHVSHHQDSGQKWRNVVIRQKQTLLSSPWMPVLRGSLWRTSLARENVTAMSYPCVVHLNCRHTTKPRPDRSSVSGPRSEDFGDLIFLDHGSTKVGDQTRCILNCFGWCYCKFNNISFLRVPLHQKSSPNFLSGWILFR